VILDVSDCWTDVLGIPDNPELLLKDIYGISPRFDRWVLEKRAQYEIRWNDILQNQLDSLVSTNAPPTERVVSARRLLNLQPSSSIAICTLMNALMDMDERSE